MKITCQACAAKYTIADEKVLGKVVKIRCKKCGATIVVNGNEPSASAGPEPPRAFDYAAHGGQSEPWTVNVADGDQRTMTEDEIVGAYQAGLVTDETYCWKDGMNDWLPVREIEGLHVACNATRAVAAPPEHHEDEGVTRVQESPLGSYAEAQPARSSVRPGGNGHAAYAEAAPIAARRPGGRAPAADLFRGAAQAGGEDDVMTSAPAGMPQPHQDDGRMTGARNENSVLFSLNALTSKGPGGPSPGAMPSSAEASGLIDIRQLGAQIGLGQDKKRSRVDDIMNLSGGGFTPAMSAPVLSAPAIEEYAPKPDATGAMGAGSAPRSKAVIYGAIGAGVLVVFGAIGAAVVMMRNKDTEATDKAAASASAATSDSASPSSTVAAAPPSATAGAAPTDSSLANSAPSASASPTDTTAGAGTSSKAPSSAPTTARTTAAAATAAAPTAAPPATTAAAVAAAAPGADQPFNMGEAKARLAAIAGSVQGCKRGDTSGSGRVVVTFAPSGGAQSAAVSGPPFEGTPTGGCVASRFRGARVPPFSGSPFSVSKSFSIN